MGWKLRGRRRYYYRSVRDGSKVRSLYVGGEGLMPEIQNLEEIEHQARLARAQQRQREREDAQIDQAFEEELDEIVASVRGATADLLAAAGYHQHDRGEWRKRQARRDQPPGS